MAGGYVPPPVPRKNTGSGMTWVFVGCGLLVLLGIVGVAAATFFTSNDNGIKKILDNASSAPDLAKSLIGVRSSLKSYREAHKGNYPPTLQNMVPEYITQAELDVLRGKGNEIDYRPPQSNATPETPVISLHKGDAKIFGQQQSNYVRLLKDDRIVMDQVTRTVLYKADSEQMNSPY